MCTSDSTENDKYLSDLCLCAPPTLLRMTSIYPTCANVTAQFEVTNDVGYSNSSPSAAAALEHLNAALNAVRDTQAKAASHSEAAAMEFYGLSNVAIMVGWAADESPI